MRRLFSAGFWVFFVTSSVACFIVAALLWVVTAPFDRDRRVNHAFSCAWASLYAYAYPGWTVRVRG
jgi:1-acyl-sn-glycerol-3-phosphate acyltransferase